MNKLFYFFTLLGGVFFSFAVGLIYCCNADMREVFATYVYDASFLQELLGVLAIGVVIGCFIYALSYLVFVILLSPLRLLFWLLSFCVK